MTLGLAKVAYVISHSMGPYFHSQVLQELQANFYSILFNEAKNSILADNLMFKFDFLVMSKNMLFFSTGLFSVGKHWAHFTVSL